MLRQASRYLVVTGAIGALLAPGLALGGGESTSPSGRSPYDVTWPDGVAPGEEVSAEGQGAQISGPRYDPTWPDGVAPGDEGASQGHGVQLSGTRYDAAWPDGVAPGSQPAGAEELQEPIYAGPTEAK